MIKYCKKFLKVNLECHGKVSEDALRARLRCLMSLTVMLKSMIKMGATLKIISSFPIYNVNDNHDAETNFYSAELVTVDDDCKILPCVVVNQNPYPMF